MHIDINDILAILDRGWVGLLGGFFISYLFYENSKNEFDFKYEMSSIKLIGNEVQELPPEVKILFNDNPVSRLTKTRIWIWNEGKKTIYGNQIDKTDPVKFIFRDTSEILSANIIKESRAVNKNTLIVNNDNLNEAFFSMDFFDRNDGVCIELLHTSVDTYPTLVGTIKEIPDGIQLTKQDKSFRDIVLTILYFCSINAYIIFCPPNNKPIKIIIFILLFLVLSFFFILLMKHKNSFNYPKSLIVK